MIFQAISGTTRVLSLPKLQSNKKKTFDMLVIRVQTDRLVEHRWKYAKNYKRNQEMWKIKTNKSLKEIPHSRANLNICVACCLGEENKNEGYFVHLWSLDFGRVVSVISRERIRKSQNTKSTTSKLVPKQRKVGCSPGLCIGLY